MVAPHQMRKPGGAEHETGTGCQAARGMRSFILEAVIGFGLKDHPRRGAIGTYTDQIRPEHLARYLHGRLLVKGSRQFHVCARPSINWRKAAWQSSRMSLLSPISMRPHAGVRMGTTPN